MDKLKKYLAELMAAGLSNAEISRRMNEFMRVNFSNDDLLKEVLKDTNVSVLDVKSREALQDVYKSISQDYAKAKNRIIANVVREAQIGIQQSLKTHEIAARIANLQGTFRSYHKTIARTAVAGFNNAFMMDKAGDGARFKYSGGAAERSFCKDLLARSANGETWTREEIEQMSNGQGSNPMYFCGGYNCKHRWLKVTDVNEKPKENIEKSNNKINNEKSIKSNKTNEFTPAQTITEANKFLNDVLGLKGEYGSLNLEAANEVNRTLQKLMSEYECSEFIGLSPFNSRFKGAGMYVTPRSINIVKKYGKLIYDSECTLSINNKMFAESIDVGAYSVEVGFLAKGNETISGIVTHEFGHILTMTHLRSANKAATEFSDAKGYRNYNPEFASEIKKVRTSYQTAMRKIEKGGGVPMENENFISRYAATSIDEFVAESFSNATYAEKPSAYAVKVKNLIDKHFKKKE